MESANVWGELKGKTKYKSYTLRFNVQGAFFLRTLSRFLAGFSYRT